MLSGKHLLEQSPRASGTGPDYIIPIGWMEQKHGFIIFDFHSNGDLVAIVFSERQENHSQIQWLTIQHLYYVYLFLYSSWSQCTAKKCQPHTARVFRTAPMETSRCWTMRLQALILMAVSFPRAAIMNYHKCRGLKHYPSIISLFQEWEI